MKQRLSVFLLAARSSIHYVLAIFFVMAVSECTVFYLLMKTSGTSRSLEDFISQSHIPVLFGIAFLLLCVCLSLLGAEYFGSKVRYTIQRLKVTEKELVCQWGVYNSICFFALWVVQLLLMLFFCRQYLSNSNPAEVGEQTLFIAFYRQNFLHNLLPLAEVSRAIRNAILVLALGFTASSFSYHRRHNNVSIGVALVAALAVLFFRHPMGGLGNDLFVIGAALLITGTSLMSLWKENENEN